MLIYIGDIYFGNTLEKAEKMNLGHRARGRKCDGPLDHSTGKGRVELHKGHYHDAARVKRACVNICLVEAGSGGVAPPFVRAIGKLSRRVKGRGGADRTRYGLARSSPRKFFTHHVQRIANAAIVGCARAMREEIVKKKASTFNGAHAAASAARYAGSVRQ